MNLEKRIPLPELAEKAEEHMRELKYSAHVIQVYRSVWNAVLNHTAEQYENFMSTELGVSTLKSHYGVDMFSETLTKYHKHLRRAVNALLEFEITGRIIKRKPRYEYQFPAGFSEIGDKFIEYLGKEMCLHPESVRNHYQHLERFFRFCEVHGIKLISEVEAGTVNDYIKTLAGYSKNFVAGQFCILKRFFDFARNIDKTIPVFRWPKVTVFKDKDIPNYYKADEIKAILEAVDRANPLGKRDYAILLLAAKYGLRAGDIRLLEFSNIDFKTNKISISQQKTGNPLSLSLLPDVGWAIIDYIQNGRPKSDCRKIFIYHRTPYVGFESSGSLGGILKKYVSAAGVKNNPEEKNIFHMLRYSLASNLLRNDVPLTTISGILGHSELNITAKYTRLDFNQLRVCALEVPEYGK